MIFNKCFFGLSTALCTHIWTRKIKFSAKFTTTSGPHSGGVWRGVFQVPRSGQPLGHTSIWSNGLRKLLPAMGGAMLGWVVSFFYFQADGSRCEGNTCIKQLQQHCFFFGFLRFCWFKSSAYAGDSLWKVRGVDFFGFVGSSRGHMQVTVFGRWGGPPKIIKFLHATQKQPNTKISLQKLRKSLMSFCTKILKITTRMKFVFFKLLRGVQLQFSRASGLMFITLQVQS